MIPEDDLIVAEHEVAVLEDQLAQAKKRMWRAQILVTGGRRAALLRLADIAQERGSYLGTTDLGDRIFVSEPITFAGTSIAVRKRDATICWAADISDIPYYQSYETFTFYPQFLGYRYWVYQ